MWDITAVLQRLRDPTSESVMHQAKGFGIYQLSPSGADHVAVVSQSPDLFDTPLARTSPTAPRRWLKLGSKRLQSPLSTTLLHLSVRVLALGKCASPSDLTGH